VMMDLPPDVQYLLEDAVGPTSNNKIPFKLL
jgi:hypothetical protein